MTARVSASVFLQLWHTDLLRSRSRPSEPVGLPPVGRVRALRLPVERLDLIGNRLFWLLVEHGVHVGRVRMQGRLQPIRSGGTDLGQRRGSSVADDRECSGARIVL